MTPRPPITASGATVRTTGRAVRVTLGAMLLPLGGFGAFAFGAGERVLNAVGFITAAEALLLVLVAALCPRLVWGQGPDGKTRVTVDDAGLVFDGRRVLSHARIANVSLTMLRGLPTVVVAGRMPLETFEISTADPEVATELAARLGGEGARLPSFPVDATTFEAERRWLVIALRAAVVLPLFGLAVSALSTKRLHSLAPAGYVPVVALSAFVVFRRSSPMRLVVGADGLAVRTDKGAFVDFVAYRDITNVSRCERGLIALVGERELPLRVAGLDPNVDAQGESLANAVELAVAHARAAERDGSLERTLARPSTGAPVPGAYRPHDDAAWRDGLQAMRAQEGSGYRALSLAEERLIELLEDAHAEPSAREGAAVLLGGRGYDDRIRGAAVPTPMPGLSAALLAAAGLENETPSPQVRVAEEASPPSRPPLSEPPMSEPPTPLANVTRR